MSQRDNSTVQVIILKSSGITNTALLQTLFSQPYFLVTVMDYLPNNTEHEVMIRALTYSTLPTLVVKDTSTSLLDSNLVQQRLAFAIEQALLDKADLIYLCKYNDQCYKYSPVTGTNMLKWSTAPTSTQAILYLPSSKPLLLSKLILPTTLSYGKLLNTYIQAGDLRAMVFVPNLLTLDLEYIESDTDYNQLSECTTDINAEPSTTDISMYVWLTIAIIIVLILVIAVILLRSPQL